MTGPSTFLLRTFGTSALVRPHETSGDERLLLGAGKPLALLTYCEAHPGASLARRQLAELFWADTPLDRRRQNIRQAIYRLRQLGDGLLDAPVRYGTAGPFAGGKAG